jgi:hypothetical protein
VHAIALSTPIASVRFSEGRDPRQNMIDHVYAGMTLSSAVPLAGLLPAARDPGRARPDFVFDLLDREPPRIDDSDWFHRWCSPDGRVTISVAKTESEFRLGFPHTADFVISSDAIRASAWAHPGVDDDDLRHLLLDQVLPRMLAHRGRLVLHASSVSLDGLTVAFAGEAGRGKSTMAASLHEARHRLLCDDGLVVDPAERAVLAMPTYRGLRLWPSPIDPAAGGSLTEQPPKDPAAKRRLVADEPTPPTELPLAAVFALAPPAEGGGEIDVRLMPARDACIELISHAFRLDLGNRENTAHLLEAAGEVAGRVPVFELRFPRDFDRLPDVHAAILSSRDDWAIPQPRTGAEG